MAISSSTFGRTLLTGEDAKQMIKQMEEKKPNAQLKESIERARQMKEKMAKLGVTI